MAANITAITLEPVDAALTLAQQALDRQQSGSADFESAAAEVERALIELACCACDAVSHWQPSEWDRTHVIPGALSQSVSKWRRQIDDLRVQAALAGEDLRDSSHQSLTAVQQAASAVEALLVGTTRDVGAALGAFRDALRPTLFSTADQQTGDSHRRSPSPQDARNRCRERD